MIADIVLIAHGGEKFVSYANLSNFDLGKIVQDLSYMYNVAYASNIDEDGNFSATFTVMVCPGADEDMVELRAFVNEAFKKAFIGF